MQNIQYFRLIAESRDFKTPTINRPKGSFDARYILNVIIIPVFDKYMFGFF
jgi:hypothetical protein